MARNSKMKAITPHFKFKSKTTTSAVLVLDDNEILTFQVIVQKIDQESTRLNITKLLADLSGFKTHSDVRRPYITAEVTDNKVTIGNGKNYGGYDNIPLHAGSTYQVYLRILRIDSKGNKVYSEPRKKILVTRTIDKPTSTHFSTLESKEKQKASSFIYTWPIIGAGVGVVVITLIIVTTVLILRRVRQKAKEKKAKELEDKNMYMTVEDAVELKKLGDAVEMKKLDDKSKKKSKASDKNKERTYATLGGTKTYVNTSSVEEHSYASLAEATRVARETIAAKEEPTTRGLYEPLNTQNMSTTGQYEGVNNKPTTRTLYEPLNTQNMSTTGQYEGLDNEPTTRALYEPINAQNMSTTGQYGDLDNKPTTRGLYEPLDTQNMSTTGQYEDLDNVRNQAAALSSVLKSI